MDSQSRPSAIVLNMFHTGLGIARSLGQRGVRVIGLSSQAWQYGNYTRFAKVLRSPDSRTDPAALFSYLMAMRVDGPKPVLFPTRDDDLAFLDAYREPLSERFALVLPPREALQICLDKWRTHQEAERLGVPSPPTFVIESERDLTEKAALLSFPCVMKPLSPPAWRQGSNWDIVNARKVVPVHSEAELWSTYAQISKATPNVLLQSVIPGPDLNLGIVACYLDRNSHWVAEFNTQKVLQVPAGFGTGCVVQAANLPELTEPAHRFLHGIGFQGIAEVEFKWDARDGKHKLIEVNARPWDQHRIGPRCGVDLMYLAYCEHAGLPMPKMERRASSCKWIAEDAYLGALLRRLWRRDPAVREMIDAVNGERLPSIWSASDPLPFIAFALRFIPEFGMACLGFAWQALKQRFTPERPESKPATN